MYADSSAPTLLNTGNGMVGISGINSIESISNSVLEEKTGLLQRDEPQMQDLLWKPSKRYELHNEWTKRIRYVQKSDETKKTALPKQAIFN